MPGIYFRNDLNPRLQVSGFYSNNGQVGQSFLDKSYNYGALHQNNGNVMSITNNKDSNRNQTFTYDSLNRITSGWSAANTGPLSWGENYAIDAWGNLMISPMGGKTSGGNFQHAGNGNNQATGLGYDAAGNLTNYTAPGQYVYDPENRIQSTAGVTYTYDADGNRVEKSGGSVSTLYWYGAPGIIAESDLSGTLKSEYVFFNGKRLARIDLLSNTVHYYLSDHLNSTSMVISGTGAVEDESDYSPFGTEYVLVSSGLNHYKFTGKERDTESQLDYFGARYYSNVTGRFITPDPLLNSGRPWDPQTWNRYGYAHNNPLSYVDPSGFYDWQANAGGSATDDELKKKSEDKDVSRKDRNAAKNALKFRDKFRAALATATAAAAGTGDSGALAAYGTEGDHNGVNVGSEPGHGGGTIVNMNDSISVNIGTDVKSGNEMAVVVAHEGQHVEDGQAWIDAGHPTGGPLDLNHYQRETRAWGVSARMAQALGMSHYGPCCRGAEDYVWNSSWHNVDRVATAIEHIVRDLYSETPGDKDAYSKENPHIHGSQLRCDCH